MSTFELIEHIECSTAQEFLLAISPFGPVFEIHFRAAKWAFRGIGDAHYKLIPSAFRDDQRQKLRSILGAQLPNPNSNSAQWFAEAMAISTFLEYADQAGLAIPEDSQESRSFLKRCIKNYEQWTNDPKLFSTSDLGTHWIPTRIVSLVALAQHYGVPTRLLDWTRSPFAAAYFGASRAKKTGGGAFSVYALLVIGSQSAGKVYFAFDKTIYRLTTLSAPRAANPNLHAQQGVFTLLELGATAPDDDTPCPALEDVLQGLDNPAPEFAPLLYKISVPHEQAPEVLWYLDQLGYNAARLYPSFEGAAVALEELVATRLPIDDLDQELSD